MSSKSLPQDLEEIAKNTATRRLASVLHFLIIDERLSQYYHEFRYVREGDFQSFNQLIHRALKDIDRLRREGGSKVEAMRRDAVLIPSMEDISEVNSLFKQFGKKYLALLLALACSYCKNIERGE